MMNDIERGQLYGIERIPEITAQEYTVTQQKKGKEVIGYYEVPASYDIETSSFRSNGEAVNITYAHIFNIDGYIFKGETWQDMHYAFNAIKDALGISYFKRLVIYVHNLSYEFQFIKNHFEFASVFNNGGDRKTLTAVTVDGIEFRCSYMLAGASLAQVAKNLMKHDIKKMNGDLDYSLIRTPETPITEEEEQYMINDVVIVEYYIRECMQEEGGITKIPLTNTGRARKYTLKQTRQNKNERVRRAYGDLISQLTIDKDEYKALRHAFAGGFTHANITNVKTTMHNVTAYDFASSYPARMISYKYPMSKGEEYKVKTKEDFYEQLSKYCCLFYIRLEGLNRTANEAYISASKTLASEHVTINNGRVESAEYVELWITEVDLKSIMLSYDVDNFNVYKLYRYKRGYLPSVFVESIIKLYEDKTMLKGVKGREDDYNRSKALVNSLYGMSVQDIIQDEFNWHDDLKESIKESADIGDKIDKYNKSRKRFLSYPWGVWITAYARHDLFKDVVKLGNDYVYCDTDSIYLTNAEDHKELFDQSNKEFITELKKAAKHHGFDFERLSPKDINGNNHTIGIWNLDGEYKRFKTLGAKRYIVEDQNDNINITVSGINKSSAVPYLKETYGERIFEEFDEHLHVPAGACGKSTHTYIDTVKTGVVTDYLGAVYEYNELSAVHLEETSYTMSISNEFSEMIEFLKKERPLSR